MASGSLFLVSIRLSLQSNGSKTGGNCYLSGCLWLQLIVLQERVDHHEIEYKHEEVDDAYNNSCDYVHRLSCICEEYGHNDDLIPDERHRNRYP